MIGGFISHKIGIMLRWLLEPEVPFATDAPSALRFDNDSGLVVFFGDALWVDVILLTELGY